MDRKIASEHTISASAFHFRHADLIATGHRLLAGWKRTKVRLAERLVEHASLEAALEPELYRLLQCLLRIRIGTALRGDAKHRAYGYPARSRFAAEKRCEANLESDRFGRRHRCCGYYASQVKNSTPARQRIFESYK